MKKNAGFTLIELVVGIAIAAIVLSAVSAVVLMGLHNNRVINQAVTVQNDSRVITQLLQNLTSRGSIKSVKKIGEDFFILSEDEGEEKTILEYHHNSKTLESADGLTLMENVDSFGAAVGSEGKVLTLTIETDGERYERSIYCRTQTFEQEGKGSLTVDIGTDDPITFSVETIEEKQEEGVGETTDPELPTENNRREFLKLLATQYGGDGTIQYGNGTNAGVTYAEWFSGGDWPNNTPWCACFVSWAAYFAHEVGLLNEAPYFAWVPNGITYFVTKDRWHTPRNGDGTYFEPVPGDYVFFNLNPHSTEYETPESPVADHVGVVLFTYMDEGVPKVVTIEGNSGGHVALREYNISSSNILGYGVLDWAPDAG